LSTSVSYLCGKSNTNELKLSVLVYTELVWY